MDIYQQVYDRLDTLPKEERMALLMEILPPQELFVRTDGMRCLIRAFGLGIFETSALLSEAGIPEDDPRCEVFRELRGGLVDRSIPNALRAIAARETTVCRRARRNPDLGRRQARLVGSPGRVQQVRGGGPSADTGVRRSTRPTLAPGL